MVRAMRSVLLLALVACGPSSHHPGNVDAPAQGSADSGECHDVVDVVFVLDVSSSMDFVLDKLDAEIDGVVTAANQLAPDAHFGLIAFADNYKRDATGAMGTIHTGGATLKTAFQNYKTNYTT